MHKLSAEAGCATEGKCQYHNEEAEHEQGCVDKADHLPTAEPGLTVPAQGVHSTPETVRQVEPDGHEPDDVEHHIDGIREGRLNLSETIGGSRVEMDRGEQLGKHHVVPEVEEVQQQTQQNDDAEHQHVLRSP